MEKRIRIGAVSYLNTRPLLFGLKRSGLLKQVELVEAYPSKVAQMLLNDEIDVGLVPIAIIPQLPESHILTDYCIGTEGEVASVAIFSEKPIESLQTILLDYQSLTSVNLAKILLKKYWKLSPVFENAKEDFRTNILGDTGGVVIGDRALEQRKISKFTYDLGSAWKAYTGLPFVFAAWVSNKPLSDDFKVAFNQANGYGIDHIKDVVAEKGYEVYDLYTYYTENISYLLTEEKRKGMALFLRLIAENK